MKYTRPDASPKASLVITAYEQAAASIQLREAVLEECKQFEESASDPLRLFQGRECDRLEEETDRKEYMMHLMTTTKRCQGTCMYLYRQYGEKVRYKGIVYTTKMCRDYVESLRALEESRRDEAANVATFAASGPQGELEIGI